MKQGSGLRKLFTLMGMGTVMARVADNSNIKYSRDTQGKDEGRETQNIWGMSNPIYIPSRSQRIKSKRLAKRNANR